MVRFAIVACALVAATMLAGCSGAGKGIDSATGTFTLSIADTLAKGQVALKGAYLHSSSGTWAEAIANGTVFAFDASGGNESAEGGVPAGSYDRLRLLFDKVMLDGKQAVLTQSGIEVAVNLTVADDGAAAIALAFAWPDSFYQSAKGLAFTPVLSRLVASEGGVETLRLEAADIATGSGKAPVARMRVFDATGLEVFGSTFVADSPSKRLVGNAGNITLSATGSEALQPGTKVAKQTWDIDGKTYTGNTVVWQAPINGGNHTIRLTVEDSDGNSDSQTVDIALKPGRASRTVSFTGTVDGYSASSAKNHEFEVDNATFNGTAAVLEHALVVLVPGAATVPVSDLNLELLDGKAARIAQATGSGSQHKIDVDVTGRPSGKWTARVIPNPAVGAAYTVTVTLTWKGVNPGLEAWLKEYDDGHTHQH